MAGSLKWFVYVDDFGTNYALFADESNTEALNGTDEGYDGTPVLVDAVPRNVRVRSAVYANDAGTRLISIPILRPATYQTLPSDKPTITDPIAGTGTLRLVRQRPEIRRLPVTADTGLNDGDSP